MNSVGPRLRRAAGGDLPAAIRRRLAPLDHRLDPYAWIATVVVVTIAALLRLIGLAHPPGKTFDELYYATDAHNLIERGYEWDEKNNTAAYVVHPPLGKWMIALGELTFGYNEFGWRIAAATVGTLMVLILTRLAQRLFRSTVLGCAAGLLLALDGFHLVLSRFALLDVFVAFFVLAAFAALVVDRDTRRRNWLSAVTGGLDPGLPGRAGRPRLGVPWWRLLAALLLGCGIAVKWSALYFVPAFGLLVLLWEVGVRRSAGARRPWRETLRTETGWLVLCLPVMLATYLASWSGWLLTDGGYLRHYRADNGMSEPPVIGALLNLWHYHQQSYSFHTTLVSEHPFQSWPWQWLLLGRPVSLYSTDQVSCAAENCLGAVLLLGTPLLWWSFLPALAALAWLGLARRDWRAGAILLGVTAGLLPWFYYALDGRTMFTFYTAPALPFLVLAVTYVLGAIATPAELSAPAPTSAEPAPEAPTPAAEAAVVRSGVAPPSGAPGIVLDRRMPAEDRRTVGAVVVGTYVLLVALCFAYFYPIFVGEPIPYDDWLARMWLGPRWY